MGKFEKRKIYLRYLRRNRRKIRRLIFLFFVLIIAVFIYFQIPAIKSGCLGTQNFILSGLKIKNIKIKNVPIEMQNKIREIVSVETGCPMNTINTCFLQNTIEEKMPELENISVKNNYFLRTLNITAFVRKHISFVIFPNGIKYLDEKGFVYIDSESGGFIENLNTMPSPEKIKYLKNNFSGFLPIVKIDKINEKRIPLEVLNFLKDIKTLKTLFPQTPVLIDTSDEKLTLTLEDGSFINWADFRFTKEKVIRVKQVIEKMDGKTKGPYTIDFSMFEHGRIFVKGK